MKTLLTLIIIAAVHAANAQTFVPKPEAKQLNNVPGRYVFIATHAGELYKEVQIIRFTNTEVFFTHSRGMETVKLADMPVDIQKACGFNPFADASPEVSTPAKAAEKKRADDIAAIAKSPVNIRIVVYGIERAGSTLCEINKMNQVKTNKRNFSGEYMFKEVETKTPVKAYILGLGGNKPEDDQGMVKVYPCMVDDPFHPSVYAMTPEAAYEWMSKPKTK